MEFYATGLILKLQLSDKYQEKNIQSGTWKQKLKVFVSLKMNFFYKNKLLNSNTKHTRQNSKVSIVLHSNTMYDERKHYNTRLLYPLSSNPPKMYSFPLMLAPQLPDMEVGNSPSIRCIVLQFSTYVKS